MSNTISDIPKELRQMMGEGEEVLYRGKTKRYAPGGEPDMHQEENRFILLKYL